MVDVPDAPGLLDTFERAQPRLDALKAGSTSRQRASELADIETYGPGYREALRGINPEQTRLRDELFAQAEADLGRRDGLDPYDERMLDESIASRFAGTPFANTPRSELSAIMTKGDRGRALEDRRRGFALQTIGLDQSLYGDPFLQITGRSGGSVPLAQSFFGNAQASNSAAGPRNYVVPDTQAFDIAGYNANAQNAANIARANNKVAGNMAWIGLAGDVLGGAAKGAAMCWVAREVFGQDNPQWLAFRHWLTTRAPRWFHALYWRHGEAFASWIHNKPFLKRIIRRWMEERIATLTRPQTPDPRPLLCYGDQL